LDAIIPINAIQGKEEKKMRDKETKPEPYHTIQVNSFDFTLFLMPFSLYICFAR